jgi:RNA polymerase sigma factor (TIGR02999 family)
VQVHAAASRRSLQASPPLRHAVVYCNARKDAMQALDPKLSALFASAGAGDAAARKELFQALYAELHRVAKRALRRNGGAMSIGATTLVHEAFLDLSGREGVAFPDRERFLAYAARAMRGLIIDHARKRDAQKRGGDLDITALDTDLADNVPDADQLSRVGEVLDELAQVEPALAEVVDLKFFCGFSFVEIAAMRSVSERTIQRDWEKARIFLYRSLRGDQTTP